MAVEVQVKRRLGETILGDACYYYYYCDTSRFFKIWHKVMDYHMGGHIGDGNYPYNPRVKKAPSCEHVEKIMTDYLTLQKEGVL